MTEDVLVRIRGDASSLDREAKKAARALDRMGDEARQTSQQLASLNSTVNFAAVASGVARAADGLGRMAKATYQMATAWRDAHREIGTGAEGVRALSQNVTDAEESIAQMSDVAGTLSAALVGALEPTLAGARVAMGAFATFTLRAAVELARLRDTVADFLISIYDQELGLRASAQTLADYEQGLSNIADLTASWTRSLQSQTQASERAAAVDDHRAKTAQEIGAAQRQLLEIADRAASDQLNDQERIAAAYQEQLDLIGEIEAAALSLSDAEGVVAATRQAATMARVEAEGRMLRELTELDLRLGEERDAARAAAEEKAMAQRKAANDLTLSNAVDTANALSGIFKEGTREAAVAQRAAGLFAIGVNTAQGITKALAELGPFGVPAAIGIGALGAAQAAAVAAQPLPSFDRGGIVDGGPQYPGGRPGQRLAQVEDGEAIFTRRQLEAMGQGGQQTVILKVGSREFGRAVIDSGALDGVQRRRSRGQRRYGG